VKIHTIKSAVCRHTGLFLYNKICLFILKATVKTKI
jgi:hypothetical protein